MTKQNVALSVNLNKIALIRNAREGNNPDLVEFATRCIELGVQGITVHPRPDQRHIRPEDCLALASLISNYKKNAQHEALEFNIEGNPAALAMPANRADFSDYPGFMAIIEQCRPDQATLVPDNDAQLTSDHGFDLASEQNASNTQQLAAVIEQIKRWGSRVSLFLDPDLDQISRARDIGADRIELYTGPFADAFANGDTDRWQVLLEQHQRAAAHAVECGLGVNAGHDLNLDNLPHYSSIAELLEVSIGHALTIDSLELGLASALQAYLGILSRDH